MEDAKIIAHDPRVQQQESNPTLVSGRWCGLWDVGFTSLPPSFDNEVQHGDEEEI